MDARKYLSIPIFIVVASFLVILMYMSFIIYSDSKVYSEYITLFESVVLVLIGLAISSKKLASSAKPKIIALSVTFGVLLYVAQFLIAYLPAFVLYTPPLSYFATALFVYLTQGLIISALLSLTDSASGSLFILAVPFYVISMISYFNPIWTPFYFAEASAAELILALGSGGYLTAFLSSLSFNVADATLASQFLLFNFGVFQPPNVQLTSVLVDIAFAAVGAALGLPIGKKAKAAWRP